MQHWIDAHLDLAYLALTGRDLMRELTADHPGCVSLPSLRAGRVDLVCATIFTEPQSDDPPGPATYRDVDDLDGAESAGLRQLALYQRLMGEQEIRLVTDQSDLHFHDPRPAVVLLMEGADPIRDPQALSRWYEAGVRMIGMTWSLGSRYAGGNTCPGPLTDLGRELVREMDRLGITHDASHLADAALDDLLDMTDGPVVATHSNCRAIAGDRQRHLRDEHIMEIARRGGVIGLNLFSRFLGPPASGDRTTARDAIRHVMHVVELAGHTRCVGLGSDMDGGFDASGLPIDVDHPTKFDRLTEQLSAEGWQDDDIIGFAWRNWHTFLERTLPVSEQ